MEALKILLTCPICLDNLANPRTLNCLHSFCTECIIKLKRYRPTCKQIECPVCKCTTLLADNNVLSLPIDFRSQQILDITGSQANAPPTTSLLQQVTAPIRPQLFNNKCGCCMHSGVEVDSVAQCVQCQMLFCATCNDKHASNRLFGKHTIIRISDAQLFCHSHSQCLAKFICRACKVLLCTVCTLEHENAHNVEEFGPETFESFKKWLQEALTCMSEKIADHQQLINEVELAREVELQRMREMQVKIISNADNIIRHVRMQQQLLLYESNAKYEEASKNLGNADELRNELFEIESFKRALESAITESTPHKSFLEADELKARMDQVINKIHDARRAVVSTVSCRSNLVFVPSAGLNVSSLIGYLQECSVVGDDSIDDELVETPSTSSSPFIRKRQTEMSYITSPPKKEIRLNFIKNTSRKLFRTGPKTGLGGVTNSQEIESRDNWITATVETRTDNSRTEVGLAIVEGLGGINLPDSVSTSDAMNNAASVQQINAAAAAAAAADNYATSTSPSSPSSTTDHDGRGSSPHDRFCVSPSHHIFSTSLSAPRLIFCVEQKGSLIGQLIKPKSAAFIDDDHLVVAESDARLQVFKGSNKAKEIYGWGKVRPVGVAVVRSGQEGPIILYTDLKDRTVKWFKPGQKEYATHQTWSANTFLAPSAIAINSKGYAVISDTETKTVSLHRFTTTDGQLNTGQLIFRLNDSNLMIPGYVAVDKLDDIYVSDQGLKCIKAYDCEGNLKRSLVLPRHLPFTTPHGICVYATLRQLFVCQPESASVHKFGLQTGDYLGTLELSSLACPVNLSFDPSCRNLVVVEATDPNNVASSYHALKVFNGF